MNVGTIVESEMLDVRLAHRTGARPRPGTPKNQGPTPLVAGRRLGQIEEYFIEGLAPGDTFLFAGEILRLLGVRETDALVVRANDQQSPKIPSYAGGKFPAFDIPRRSRPPHAPRRKAPEEAAATSARLDQNPETPLRRARAG